MRSGRLKIAVLLLCGCGGGDPLRLSQTGLYADFDARRVTDGIVPVRPRYPLWSDGAEKQRWIQLPAGARIDTSEMDDWHFPIGTRVWKEFRLDGRLIETRLLEKRSEPDDGGWFRMAYAWRDDESDADAAPQGVKAARGTSYDIPSQTDCGSCHYKGEKPVIGISALQLATSSDGGPAPIEALQSAGLLTTPPARTYLAPGAGEVQDALGYLHGNCGHCHDSRSAAAADVKVFMQLLVDDLNPAQTHTYTSVVGQPIHHFPDVGLLGLAVPGDPDHSLVPYRMGHRDAAQMPPLATHRVDDAGLQLVRQWITDLPQ